MSTDTDFVDPSDTPADLADFLDAVGHEPLTARMNHATWQITRDGDRFRAECFGAGGGWYAKKYPSNGTVGLETVALVTSGNTITLPNPPINAKGLRVQIVGLSGDEATNNVTIDDSGDGAGGGGSFPFTIATDYGSAEFYRTGSGNWSPNLGGA